MASKDESTNQDLFLFWDSFMICLDIHTYLCVLHNKRLDIHLFIVKIIFMILYQYFIFFIKKLHIFFFFKYIYFTISVPVDNKPVCCLVFMNLDSTSLVILIKKKKDFTSYRRV